MESELYVGKLVRLTSFEPDEAAEAFSRWSRESEFMRLQDSSMAVPWSTPWVRRWMDRDLEKDGFNSIEFAIRTLDGDRFIGSIGLADISLNNRDAYVGIGIGERSYWGKGFGTDAMQIILRYAFNELNLHRVTLNVFEYNPRAIRSYEKAGFSHEGRMRNFLNRDGRRWDLIYMGILREEWVSRGQ